jgi:hypothetical protein
MRSGSPAKSYFAQNSMTPRMYCLSAPAWSEEMTYQLAHDYPQIFPVYPIFEAVGFSWTTVCYFEEKDFDDLLLSVHFLNDEGTTRLLELTLSRAGVCTDVHGKYHEEVMAWIQDWLWSSVEHG